MQCNDVIYVFSNATAAATNRNIPPFKILKAMRKETVMLLKLIRFYIHWPLFMSRECMYHTIPWMQNVRSFNIYYYQSQPLLSLHKVIPHENGCSSFFSLLILRCSTFFPSKYTWVWHICNLTCSAWTVQKLAKFSNSSLILFLKVIIFGCHAFSETLIGVGDENSGMHWKCGCVNIYKKRCTFIVCCCCRCFAYFSLGKRYFVIAYIPSRTLCFVKSGVENSFNMPKTQKQTKYLKKKDKWVLVAVEWSVIMFLTPSKPRFSSTYFVYILFTDKQQLVKYTFLFYLSEFCISLFFTFDASAKHKYIDTHTA